MDKRILGGVYELIPSIHWYNSCHALGGDRVWGVAVEAETKPIGDEKRKELQIDDHKRMTFVH